MHEKTTEEWDAYSMSSLADNEIDSAFEKEFSVRIGQKANDCCTPIGRKDDEGKTMAGLLEDFSLALTAVADHATSGARKYGRSNWLHVENAEERYKDAKWRHLLASCREDYDKDGLINDVAVIWNCLALLELKLRKSSQK